MMAILTDKYSKVEKSNHKLFDDLILGLHMLMLDKHNTIQSRTYAFGAIQILLATPKWRFFRIRAYKQNLKLAAQLHLSCCGDILQEPEQEYLANR